MQDCKSISLDILQVLSIVFILLLVPFIIIIILLFSPLIHLELTSNLELISMVVSQTVFLKVESFVSPSILPFWYQVGVP